MHHVFNVFTVIIFVSFSSLLFSFCCFLVVLAIAIIILYCFLLLSLLLSGVVMIVIIGVRLVVAFIIIVLIILLLPILRHCFVLFYGFFDCIKFKFPINFGHYLRELSSHSFSFLPM